MHFWGMKKKIDGAQRGKGIDSVYFQSLTPFYAPALPAARDPHAARPHCARRTPARRAAPDAVRIKEVMYLTLCS
jgi:hypothetical protein